MEASAKPLGFSSLLLRTIAFQFAFLVFHFAYGWFPGPFTAIFSGTDESVFQHMKIGFYAWFLISLGEFLLGRTWRPGREEVLTFISSRLFSAVMGPWAFTLLWYLAAATVGPLPSDLAEILWANLVVFVTGLFMAKLEDRLSERKANAFFIVSSLLLGLLFVYLSIRFTLEKPWTDLFAPPIKR